jgi:hypothetical protein
LPCRRDWLISEQGGNFLNENDLVRQTAQLLRTIIRSIDKKLEYRLMEQSQEGIFALRLAARGREGNVSLRTNDLLAAVDDPVMKNNVRQKIKSKRDHLLSNYVVDVMGTKEARLLKESAQTREAFKPEFRRRPPMGRRR